MADSPTPILQMREMTTGSQTNLWGPYNNTSLKTLERATRGYQAYTATGSATISWTNYSASNDFSAVFTKIGGSPTAAYTITLPSYQTFQAVWNNSGQTGTIKNSGGTGVPVPTGRKALLYGDATDIYEASPNWLNNYASTLTNAGDIVVKTTLESAIANASLPATAGTVLVSVADTSAGYIGAKIVAGTGIDTTDSGAGAATLTIAVDTTELEEFLALTGKITATLSSGTTAMTARRRYRISSTATGTLPTMVDGDFVIVEFTVGGGVTATVGRNSQTIDGAAEDDTYLGTGGDSGPVVRYQYSSAGVVTSEIIGGVPI